MLGSCLCGEIQFKLMNTVFNLYQCHCSLCRKQSGGAANAATLVSKSDFSWEKGTEQIRSYVKPTGFRSDFCANCGSPVPNVVGQTSYIWITAGLLDGVQKLKIITHLFIGSKAEWEPAPIAGKNFEEGPGVENLFQLLHRD